VRSRLTRRLSSLLKEMETNGCLGSLAEMYDAEEPMLPRGCFAQAWSVAEAIRLYARLKAASGRRRAVAKLTPKARPRKKAGPEARPARTESRR
jgi:glycogen debranching enzyme